MKITQEVRAFALEQAGRRCECTGKNCRHHLRGARCKRGLRGDEWKVFWRTEDGGTTRENIEAWCPDCFANNYQAPVENVALLALDIVGYSRLLEENHRTAITLKSVLRDATERAAGDCRGRLVLDRLDDDILAEFPSSADAIKATRTLCAGFQDVARRLELPVPELSGALHCGEVTRWRSGLLVGDAVDLTTRIRGLAGVGQIVLTGPAAEPIRQKVELEPVSDARPDPLAPIGEIWALRL